MCSLVMLLRSIKIRKEPDDLMPECQHRFSAGGQEPEKAPSKKMQKDIKKRIQLAKADLDVFIGKLMNGIPDSDGKFNIINDVKEIHELCLRARRKLMNEKALLHLKPNIIILGDIHGQFIDLRRMFELLGSAPKRRYLFLGDYVDRGRYSLETICLLLALKLRFPSRFYLLRGNHEARSTNIVYGFIEECRSRFGKKEGIRMKVWTEFQHVFNCMPISALISKRIFCAHGGISQDLLSWKQFDRIARPTDVIDSGLITDLLWSDPCAEIEHYAISPRNVSQVFGKEAVNEFCDRMNVDLIVRGHQAVLEGYETMFDKRCVTIFSAPNYTEMKNKAACMYVSKKLKCSIYNYAKEDNTLNLKEQLTVRRSN